MSAESPARNAISITPSDTVNLETGTRGIYVGGGGDITAVMEGSANAVLFVDVPGGAVLPIEASRVNATGTTATDLVALW